MKKEKTNRKAYQSLQKLQLSVFEYIEGLYYSKRPHALGMPPSLLHNFTVLLKIPPLYGSISARFFLFAFCLLPDSE